MCKCEWVGVCVCRACVRVFACVCNSDIVLCKRRICILVIVKVYNMCAAMVKARAGEIDILSSVMDQLTTYILSSVMDQLTTWGKLNSRLG